MLPEHVAASPAAQANATASTEQQPTAKPAQSARPYLYELDRLRIITALSVVAVHVTALTAFLDATLPALQVQNAFVTLFHFTRAVFMFVTAFALVYVYSRKPFTWGEFWKRRGIGVLFPYVFWTIVYVLVNVHPDAPLPFIRILLSDLLTGGASYQLYYILLTIQFYIIFPWFLKGVLRVAHRPWLALSISFVLELGILFAIQNNLQGYLPDGIASVVNQFANSFVLTYQFYFLLGGLVALHMNSVRAFLLRHGWWVGASMAVALAALELNYLWALQIAHESLDAAVAVLQPIMAFYSTAVIFFLYWLACRQVSRIAQPATARGQRVWHTLSDASFGIYLVHPLFLSAFSWLVVNYFLAWPPVLLVPLIWLCTAGCSVASSVLLLRIPLLSRLVGRTRPLPQVAAIQTWKQRLSRHAADTRPHQAETAERGTVALARQHVDS